MEYYADKIHQLQDLFGVNDVAIKAGAIQVGTHKYPVVDDVIILLPEKKYPPRLKATMGRDVLERNASSGQYAPDIQETFGNEWQKYNAILPDHAAEFHKYFDLIDLDSLRSARVCDLGCGNGRWSWFLQDRCRELILVDFSDAIFVARKNLSRATHCLFFMGDLQELPFRKDFADFLFCLGVLHHLPTPCLEAVRELKKISPKILVYLYYALDNRPWYFRWILGVATTLRRALARVRHPTGRKIVATGGVYVLYRPLIALGRWLDRFHLGKYVPLYEFYHDKTTKRIEQDVYDRLFTRIEQRVTKAEILQLQDTFREVLVSNHLPWWHFLCLR